MHSIVKKVLSERVINHFCICLFLVLCLPGKMNSQSYYYQLTYGIDENSFEWGWNPYMKTIWTSGTASINDVLSPAQSLPFTWNFYGSPVIQYKISDNGYITFDTSSNTSYPVNGTLPSAGSPNNAIYGFWRDFEIAPNVYDHVVTWTYGTAPNRVHVIEWQSLSPVGNTTQLNATYFAIRLYEGGDFDIVHIWGRNNNADMNGGTVGVENNDGSLGTMTYNSPNESMKMPVVLPEDVPVYKFTYGTQPLYDMAGLSLDLPEVVKAGTNVTVKGKLINYGTTTIFSFDLNYMVDGGTVQTEHITGMNIRTNAKYSFTHGTPWNAAGAGNIHTVTVWASSLNGNNDDNPVNDSVKFNVFVNNGIAASKKALIEEFSTAPCGFCVDGLYITQTILNTYPNAVGFTHHAGYQTDSMTIPESKTYESIMGTGAPMAAIDRVKWPGEANLCVSRSNNSWVNKMVTQMNEVTPVNVNISTNYNTGSRILDITVTAKFVDYTYPGDLRLNAFVIEDSVTGNGDGYDQHNYYSHEAPGGAYGGTSHPFYPLPYIITGFVHRHVIRAMPSGLWGTAGIIPNAPALNENYSMTYHYTIPPTYKVKDISVIAFVSYFTADYSKLRILNTQEMHEATLGTPEKPVTDEPIFRVFPNPASGIVNVSFVLQKKAPVSLKVINNLGQVVATTSETVYSEGFHNITLCTFHLPSGYYNVILQNGNTCSASGMVVVK